MFAPDFHLKMFIFETSLDDQFLIQKFDFLEQSV